MTDSFVTQCPHCRTSFRVSTSQLSAAHGAVRCGACLHVFNATEHLLDQPKAHSANAPTPAAVPATPVADMPAAPESAPTARKDPLDTVWIHDDLDLDSLDLDEELARLEQEEQQRARAFIPFEPQTVQARQANQAPAAPTPADERWAEQLIEESQPAKARPSEEVSSAIPGPERQTEPAPGGKPAATESDNADDDAERQPEAFEAQATVEEIELTAAETESHSASALHRHENLFELNQDPLQLDWQPPRKPWGRWLGWGSLNLLAAAALATQWSLYNFEELARQDKYRPWFEAVCPHFGCTLPSKVDINLIKSSNLVVRSHPEFAGALVVDAILYNRAGFSQPFPLLELRFSDIDNRLLANRRFKPSEYVAGELSGQSEMPPQTPIRISLDILDPGQDAVNYSLSFQSPE